MTKNRFLFILVFGLLAFSTVIAQPRLVGVCAEGGIQFGTIMKYVAGDTALTDVYKLPGTPGGYPQHTGCVDINGKVYGLTKQGGAYNGGIIYEYDYNTGIYSKKIDLDGRIGAYGTGAMVPGNNGYLYGVTYSGGGPNSSGVIFEYDYQNNSYFMKKNLGGLQGSGPAGSLLLASNNKFYGMTVAGGNNYRGVLFEYDYLNNIYSKKHDFSIPDGGIPFGSLVEAPNGKLYGLTSSGGLNNMGVIFEYDFVSETYVKKIDLDTLNGGSPFGSFVLAPNGKMYAMTSEGGVGNGGVLFEYDYVNNNYVNKIDLGFNAKPQGSLIVTSNGMLYGMTRYGGTQGDGVIFEYDFNTNTLTNKFSLTDSLGIYPMGSLVEASNGLLYGSTYRGNKFSDQGVFFEYDYNNNIYNVITEFAKSEAREPSGSLVQAPNGKMYGQTKYGGLYDRGSIFEYDYVSNTFTKKIAMTVKPWGDLLLANNGKFYGAAVTGQIYEYDYQSNAVTIKANFVDSLGRFLNGSMIEATNGKIYGMGEHGGTQDEGVIFEFNPVTNVITKKHDFDSTFGIWPNGALIQASNGKLYGMTNYGGTSYSVNWGKGTLFEYNYVSNTFIKRVDFTDSTGFHPWGSLIQASNGKLYGTTSQGGSNGFGVIFEYNPNTNIYTRKINLDATNGGNAYGSLFEASNGKLYGMTHSGGVNERGVIFEYDYNTNTFIRLVDLVEPVTGYSPINSFTEFHCLPPQIIASGPISFCQGGSVTLTADVDSSSLIQWYRNAAIIPGASNKSLLVTTVGSYTVSVSNALCPSLISTPIKVRIPCILTVEHDKISGSEISADEFMFDAYFDPASDNLNLTASGVNGNNYNIAVFDQSGKLIMKEKGVVKNGELSKQFDFTVFAQSVYVVRFTTEIEQGVQKFYK